MTFIRPTLLALSAVTLAACQMVGITQSNPALPDPPREFRGVWVATVSNIDWPSARGLSADMQRDEMDAILDRCEQNNINAIVFQIRTSCDALYDSDLEPWSIYLTGTAGENPGYDPLAYAVEKAHDRGIEVHAWFNPLRARVGNYEVADNHVSHTIPDAVVEYGNYLWLNPGVPAAMEHSMNVILDVIRRYDIDGIHFDDYFYPYPVEGQEFPDEEQYQAYVAAGGTMNKGDWRRDNINDFFEALYTNAHAIDPTVRVGISPFGIWRPGYPEGIVGFDAYEQLACDPRLWMHEGWVDYLTPQLYWAIDSAGQSYPKLMDWWASENPHGRHLWPGLFTSRLNNQWEAEEIVNQVALTQQRTGATGNVHFSEKAFGNNWGGINEALTAELYAERAIPPATDWLDSVPPAAPRVGLRGQLVAWQNQGTEEPWLWIVQQLVNGEWSTKVLPRGANAQRVISGATRAAVRCVDRVGNIGAPSFVEL